MWPLTLKLRHTTLKCDPKPLTSDTHSTLKCGPKPLESDLEEALSNLDTQPSKLTLIQGWVWRRCASYVLCGTTIQRVKVQWWTRCAQCCSSQATVTAPHVTQRRRFALLLHMAAWSCNEIGRSRPTMLRSRSFQVSLDPNRPLPTRS